MWGSQRHLGHTFEPAVIDERARGLRAWPRVAEHAPHAALRKRLRRAPLPQALARALGGARIFRQPERKVPGI